jgi:large subunit ribosomal protein L11
MIIKLLVEGGAMKPGPALSQQLGPAGINIGQVISKVNESTTDFKGLKVPVELNVDTGTKAFEVKVFSPPVSELVKKQIGIEKGSGEQKKMQAGNASIEDIVSVAKTKFPNMLCKDLKAAVKTVLGTCGTLGILVENKPAIDVVEHIKSGKYDNEIKEEKTETDPEKRKKLEAYFKETHTAQEKQKQVEEAEAEAAKAAKEAPVDAEATPEGEAKPAEAAKPAEEKK